MFSFLYNGSIRSAARCSLAQVFIIMYEIRRRLQKIILNEALKRVRATFVMCSIAIFRPHPNNIYIHTSIMLFLTTCMHVYYYSTRT